MHVVAVEPFGEVTDEGVQALVEVTGASLYQARMRLGHLLGWPGVVASAATREEAQSVAERLRRAGLDAWSLPRQVRSTAVLARRYALDERVIAVECDGGLPLRITLDEVRLLLRVRHVTSERTSAIAAQISYDVLRLVDSPLQTFTPPTSSSRLVAREFVRMYAAGHPTVVFALDALQYAAGSETLQPTRTANFAQAVQSLRTSCSRARYDERLLTRAGQLRVLGGMLRPEEHLDVAIRLLARHPPPPDPYRSDRSA